ncbi:tetratricopeptide repeat protein [Treponema sp.]|uniref:tetratricopeptide repeat protein n=1 Tax=Treponema sp. TaxID=166 RepID=UPI00298DE804|nr:tetratricopeptide repeat protein [Treponema sp.]
MKKKFLICVILFQVINVFSQTNINRQIQQAEELYLIKQFDEALVLLNSVITQEPNNIYALMDRSCVYDALNEYEKALEDINKVLENNPNNLKARHIRGGIYGNAGEFDKAIEDENFVLGKVPLFTSGLNVRGLAYGRIGMYEKAIADFTSAITISNYNYESSDVFLLNRAYMYFFQKKYKESLQDIEMSLIYNNRNPEALALKSKIYRVNGNFEESTKWITQAISNSPEYYELYYLRILNYLQVNNLEFAKNDLEYIKNERGNTSAFHSLMALYYYLNDDTNSALRELLVSKELNGNEEGAFSIMILTDDIKTLINKERMEEIYIK